MSLQNTLFSPIDVNEEFRKALRIMEGSDRNVFITGRAGTGKSTLLQYFRSSTKKRVVVLAPTGVAALNVKGQTIHSFFRFKPDITLETVKKLDGYSSRIYQELDSIVIDEISMVRSDLLDCVDKFMRLNGKNESLPFGGVQTIFIGDLYQLSPVVTDEEQEIFKSHYKSQYFFDSNAFRSLPIEYVELIKHYRQTDSEFIELLNSIRENAATDRHISEINKRFNPFFVPNESEPYITLTTTNKLANEINSRELSKIQSRTYSYRASVEGDFKMRVLPADERLALKEGAQVMLLNNDPKRRWVNGTIGKVVSIAHEIGENDTVMVQLADGTTVGVEPYKWEIFKFSYDNSAKKLLSNRMGGFVQYPIMLAWAVTIHKSQGKTFDRVIIDIGSGTFAHGQLYVALSRCTTMEGIVLRKMVERRHILMDGRILEFLNKTKQLG